MKKIIIGGRACSGKDEVADYLVREYGYVKITFATPIYHICRKYFGMNGKDRALLQLVGQKLREVDRDVWVKAAFKEAENHEKVVIPDCRQANEYLYAKQNGFIPLRVHSDLEKRIERSIQRDGLYPNIDDWENESEIGADNYEYHEIYNNGTLGELYSQVEKFLRGGK